MVLVVSFFIISMISHGISAEGVPVAVVENASFNFGSIYEGTDVIHDFIIQNKGDADLEIVDVKAG